MSASDVVVGCDWFAQCDNVADGVVSHSVLGWVPTCERCATNLGLDLVAAVFEAEIN